MVNKDFITVAVSACLDIVIIPIIWTSCSMSRCTAAYTPSSVSMANGPLLPAVKTQHYLRTRPHNLTLTRKSCHYDNCNFISRMIFYDVYWLSPLYYFYLLVAVRFDIAFNKHILCVSIPRRLLHTNLWNSYDNSPGDIDPEITPSRENLKTGTNPYWP